MNKKERLKEETKNLGKLELELIDFIFETKSDKLKFKFTEWQNQRTLCNELYNEYIEELKADNK